LTLRHDISPPEGDVRFAKLGMVGCAIGRVAKLCIAFNPDGDTAVPIGGDKQSGD
jgi:hypothetical protein